MKKIFKGVVEKVITWEAKLALRKYKPHVIGVTGSVGKTSTKDAIYTVLAPSFPTRKSEKSFNSEIGVPLTILGLKNAWTNPFLWIWNIVEGLLLLILPCRYPKWLVLEVGADKPGDIRSVSKWLKPDITVLTRFGDVPVHVEFFPSIDALVEEKGYLAKAIRSGGTLVYNSDDRRINAFVGDMLDMPGHTRKKISYGFEPGAEVAASHEEVMYGKFENSELEFPYGMSYKVNLNGSSVPMILTNALGRQHIYPMLAAFSVGIALGINPVEISQRLMEHVTARGRMKLIAGIKDTLIIDDTYNSSPVAVHAALGVLKSLRTFGRKIAVLGDMMELGDYSVIEHKKTGEAAVGAADILVTVGVRSRNTADAALDANMDENNVLQFESSKEAGRYLDSILQPGDILLVKGSQAMRMERVVEEIMEKPEDAEKLLVRQDKQWKAKV